MDRGAWQGTVHRVTESRIATGRTPPIPRSALEKDPRPGPLFEGALESLQGLRDLT